MNLGSLAAQTCEPDRAKQDYAGLVRAVMDKRGVSVRRLHELGIIRKCTARAFDERLSSGDISNGEFEALFEHLQIDPLRATLALSCLDDPEAYFDPTCRTVAELARYTVETLHEQVASCEGDFEPVRRSLCQSLAKRMSGMIVEHHNRIEEARMAEF